MDKKSFSTCMNFGRYRKFVKNLTQDQTAIVKSCGLEALLHFDCTEAPISVGSFLAKCFDVNTRTVKLQNGSSFQLNAFVVHQILGVPLGGRRIRDLASNTEKAIIANDTGTSTIAPTVDQLFDLVTDELTGDKFARIFLLISLSIFLCPTSQKSASKHYYSAVACVEDIPKYDWCSFILDWLVDGIVKFQKSKGATPTLGRCFFVLVVAYFEYIKTPHIILREDLPHIKIWDDYMIGEFLALEGNNGGATSFGLLELKDPSETPFVNVRASSSSFAKLPREVESFIKSLAPHNAHPNVRGDIRDMCSKFHSEIMTTSLGVIQLIVSRQLCSMAEYMWMGLQNQNAPGTSAPAAATSTPTAKHVAVGSSSQMQRETEIEAAKGVTTRSRTSSLQPQADAAMSSAIRKNTNRGMRATSTKNTRSKSDQVPKSSEIPIQTGCSNCTSNTDKDPVSSEISAENRRDIELDTSQNNTVAGVDKDPVSNEISAVNESYKELDATQDKSAGGGDKSATDVFPSPANNSNQCATNSRL